MFIIKDTRKIPEILNVEDEEEFRTMKLARRRNEFKDGVVKNTLFKSSSFIHKLRTSEYLSLYGNELKSINGIELLEGGNLCELNLGNNFLTSLPAELSSLKNSLKILWLDDNKLEEFPPQILELENLTSLRLSRNRIKKLPPQIRMLPNLQEFSIDNNDLTYLPDTLNELENLRSFNVRQNKLSALPDLGQLKSLENLAASSNSITSVPLGLEHLDKLKFLFLNGNNILEFPCCVLELSCLVKLNLSNNEISVIPEVVRDKWGEIDTKTERNPCVVEEALTSPKKKKKN